MKNKLQLLGAMLIGGLLCFGIVQATAAPQANAQALQGNFALSSLNTTAATGTTVKVTVDGRDYQLPLDVPVVAAVMSVDVQSQIVGMRIFEREGNTFLPEPPHYYSMTGNLANAKIDDYYVLVPNNGGN